MGTRARGGDDKVHDEEERIVEGADPDVGADADAAGVGAPATSSPAFQEGAARAGGRAGEPEPEFERDEFDGEIGDEWDWGDKSEKMWGEVALAPGVTTEKRDEWVVIGSWGEDERA